jgi:hypothetical protein
MKCPEGYIKAKIKYPPYYICIPIEEVNTKEVPKSKNINLPLSGESNYCYTVYTPVLLFYNYSLGIPTNAYAFTFNPSVETIKIKPSTAKKKAGRPIVSTVTNSMDVIANIIYDKLSGNVPKSKLRYVLMTNVFEPLCKMSYVAMKIKPVFESITSLPIAIGSEYDIANYISSLVLSSSIDAKAEYYTSARVNVQFITSVEQLELLLG